MPKNKEALIRYRVINRCLKDYNYCTKDKLIEACERALDIAPIGERTIAQDIHDMRNDNGLGYYAPIRFSRDRGGYYYEDPDYSIDKLPLSSYEVDSLEFAASLLEQFRDFPVLQDFGGAVQKIRDALEIHRAGEDEEKPLFIEFEKVPRIKGSEYLPVLIKMIRDKRVVKIAYHAFSYKEPKSIEVHPYLLKEYRNRWYLVGYSESHGAIRTLGLDRIKAIEESEREYSDRGFDPSEYFKYSFGITCDGSSPEQVVLAVKNAFVPYLLTQPLHESQVIVDEGEEETLLQLTVLVTPELIAEIFSYGINARVVGPDWLVKDVRDRLETMVGFYRE